jgi:hypothetical protein
MVENLRIISSDKIIAFESPSTDRVAKIAAEMARDDKLKNPLLVYPLNEKYLMIDDVSILEALKSLEVTHIPIQLADIERLSVNPWQRVVENWYKKDLIHFCERFPRQIRISFVAKSKLERQQAEIRFRDKTCLRLTLLSDSYLVRAEMLRNFFADLTQAHQCFRAKLDIGESDPLRDFPNSSAAIFPPVFDITELADMAVRKMYLPQGIVRVDQPGRVLGIDYSLSILREDVSSEEKESFLKQMIHMRMSSDRTAYYEGFVYMFNS